MLAWAAWVEVSPLGTWARGDADAYPIANLVHLLGLVCLVGGIGILDLRLIGLWRALPLRALAAALTPVAVLGLLLIISSGPILFAADATALVRSSYFQAKMALILVALCNVLLFRRLWRGGEATALLRASAVLSLALWLTVGALGRLIAYA